MKKILSIFTVLVLLISLCACATSLSEVAESESYINEIQENKNPAENNESVEDSAIITELNAVKVPIVGRNNAAYADRFFTAANYLKCYDANGSEIWEKSITGILFDPGRYIGWIMAENFLVPSDGGVIYVATVVEDGNVRNTAYSVDAEGNERWSVEISEWNNISSIISDGNDGVILIGNREVSFHDGGNVIIRLNAEGEIIYYGNIPFWDKSYIYRKISAVDYCEETNCLYAAVNEDSDGLYDDSAYLIKIDMSNETVIENRDIDDVLYLCSDDENGRVVAVSRDASYVLDDSLTLLHSHKYTDMYSFAAYGLPDGDYMIYCGSDNIYYEHRVYIYGADGTLKHDLEFGAAAQNIQLFSQGFIVCTHTAAYRYSYNGDLIDRIYIGSGYAGDYNNIFFAY